MRIVRFEDGSIGLDIPEPSPEEVARRKAHSTRCGHVKRRLLRDEPLTDKTLEFALDLLGDRDFDLDIAAKLKAGSKLGDYEKHIMVDVLLLHAKLRGP